MDEARAEQRALGFYNSRMPASARSKWRSAPSPTFDHSPTVTAKHVAEAVQHWSLDRKYWT